MTRTQPTPPPVIIKTDYENNPFFVAANGISLLFKYAKSVAITLTVLSVLGAASNITGNIFDDDKTTSSNAMSLPDLSSFEATLIVAVIFVLLFVSLVVSVMISGIQSYSAVQAGKNRTVTIKESFNEVLGRFGEYGWMYVLRGVKLFGWYLLFIVPGIYFSVRYSLAGVAFFDDSKNVKGNAAIAESTRLTKDGWLTTYASTAVFNFITFGTLGALITTSANAILYRQYDLIDKSGAAKPQPHALSWATLILTFVLIVLAIAVIAIAAIILASIAN